MLHKSFWHVIITIGSCLLGYPWLVLSIRFGRSSVMTGMYSSRHPESPQSVSVEVRIGRPMMMCPWREDQSKGCYGQTKCAPLTRHSRKNCVIIGPEYWRCTKTGYSASNKWKCCLCSPSGGILARSVANGLNSKSMVIVRWIQTLFQQLFSVTSPCTRCFADLGCTCNSSFVMLPHFTG